MISVLICSINPDLLNNVTENIKETIGVPFEILYADNQKTKKEFARYITNLQPNPNLIICVFFMKMLC